MLVDTSGLYAVLDELDPAHGSAREAFAGLSGEDLLTHSYVVVESASLVQSRLGNDAVRDLRQWLLGPVEVVWVDRDLHEAGMSALLAAGRRDISLVDWVSFELMRRRGIETAFAFDRDFEAQGFTIIP